MVSSDNKRPVGDLVTDKFLSGNFPRPPVKPTGLASGHSSGILLRIKFPPPLRTAAKAVLLQAAVLTPARGLAELANAAPFKSPRETRRCLAYGHFLLCKKIGGP